MQTKLFEVEKSNDIKFLMENNALSRGFWTKKNIERIYKNLCDCRSWETVTADEWTLLSCSFAKALLNKKSQEEVCDYVVIGSSWYQDESHIRHISMGNWPDSIDLGRDMSIQIRDAANEIFSASEDDSCDIASEIGRALHEILKEFGIKNPDKIWPLMGNGRTVIWSDEAIYWKLISGGSWKLSDIANAKSDEDEEHTSSDSVEDGLYLVYLDGKYNVRSYWFAELYISEPELSSPELGGVTWNH